MLKKKPENSLPGWVGPISRIEAEHQLENQPIGTFVLRQEDDLTARIRKGLTKENREVMESYLLTVVESRKKIVDHWILHTPDGWTFYQDNPDLHDKAQYHFYPTIEDLLLSVSNIVCVALRKQD